jgi:hypothetical protein
MAVSPPIRRDDGSTRNCVVSIVSRRKCASNAGGLPYFARLSFISLRCQSQAVQHKLRQSVAAGASAATPRGRTHRNRGSEAIATPLDADWITDQPSARGRSNR